MESINLDMADIFDDGGGEDEDFGAMPATLPDLDDGDGPLASGGGEENGEQNEGDEGEVIANLQRLSKGAAKKRVLKPQPKLDAQRLKTERGLPSLLTMFDNVKFKGKGQEASDLKIMMSKLEHWGHRLFPKMPFDEFTERLEKLGSQKPVKTMLTKIRLDMPILDADVVQQFDDEDGVADGPAAQETEPSEVAEMDAEEAYEEMVRMEREQQMKEPEAGLTELPASPGGRTPSSQPPRLTANTPVAAPTSNPDQPPQKITTTKGISEEQKERMERNKRKALEKRAARMGVPISTLLPNASQVSQPSVSMSQSANVDERTPSKKVTPTKYTPRQSQTTPSRSYHNSTESRIETSPKESVSEALTRMLVPSCSADSSAEKVDATILCPSVEPAKVIKKVEGTENDTLMETDELLNMLEDTDMQDTNPSEEMKNKHTGKVEFSAPPENTEALMDQVNLVTNNTMGIERHASADSDMDTESYGLHLTLDTTVTDEEEKMVPATDCDKENSAIASNVDSSVNSNAREGKIADDIIDEESLIL